MLIYVPLPNLNRKVLKHKQISTRRILSNGYVGYEILGVHFPRNDQSWKT